MLNSYIIYFFIIVIGLFSGSFAYTLILRIPESISLLSPSYCPKCLKAIPIRSLIPIISYIFQKGKCVYCKEKINISYLLVELFSLIITIMIYMHNQSINHFIFWQITWLLLFINAFFDLKFQWLNNWISLILIVIGICYLLLFKNEEKIYLLSSMLAVAGLFYFVKFIHSTIRKKEMLGDGDITLVGIIGLLFGWKDTIIIVFYSSIIGIILILISTIIAKKNISDPLSYGFVMIIVAFITWIFPFLRNIIFITI